MMAEVYLDGILQRFCEHCAVFHPLEKFQLSYRRCSTAGEPRSGAGAKRSAATARLLLQNDLA